MRTTRRDLTRPEGRSDDEVAVEEPLEIRVEGRPLAVTMRTPGDDLELAAGFLYTEQVIDGRDDLVAIAHVAVPGDDRGNTVDALLAGGVEAHRAGIEKAVREMFATSSCGICGKASIDKLLCTSPPLHRTVELHPAVIVGLPERLRKGQPAFDATGGLHAAGLADFTGAVEIVREDVGRHNAVDKVLGWRLLADRVPVEDRILVVTSRAGFEIVQKALVARIPAIVAVGAPTSLAVDLAVASRIALYGFVRDGRWNRYA
jgi:FdhD protein